ncbi:hypothetical protein EVAR_7755_1 [Eumeta japonica]|uniref:Uncharacterized protein n=1 Tax=Eumeta variegata TaxID=151549 RepID=A0A4C1TIY1_EUMVA|nr:hypothetical protein EVAR_7755_1 [Eumeta japonica]
MVLATAPRHTLGTDSHLARGQRIPASSKMPDNISLPLHSSPAGSATTAPLRLMMNPRHRGISDTTIHFHVLSADTATSCSKA